MHNVWQVHMPPGLLGALTFVKVASMRPPGTLLESGVSQKSKSELM